MAFQIHERAEQFVDSAIRVRAVRGLEAASGESEGLGWPDHPAQLQRDVRRQAHVRILEIVAEDLYRHP